MWELGYTNLRNGQTDIAAAGTPVPLLGVTYATGTVKATPGTRIFTGTGTTFSAANTPPGYRFLTAGGNPYTILKHHLTTRLEVMEDIADETDIEPAEAGVAFKVYEMPQTAKVLVWPERGNTGGLFIGVRGSTSATTSGYPLALGTRFAQNVNLANVDLWVDVATSGDDADWILLW